MSITVRIQDAKTGRRAEPLGPTNDNWQPTLTASLIVPAVNQDSLDITLAALSAQSYPADLMEVIVVGGSAVAPITISALEPTQSRIIACAPTGPMHSDIFGRAAEHATGETLIFLPPSLLLCREAVEAHMRWHHTDREFMVQGAIGGVGTTGAHLTARQVKELVINGEVGTHLQMVTRTHDWAEGIVGVHPTESDDAPYDIVCPDMWPSISWSRRLHNQLGCVDLETGNGIAMDLCYRLSQCGATLVNEPTAEGWLNGGSEQLRKCGCVHPILEERVRHRIPTLRAWRTEPLPQREVPYIDAVIHAESGSYEAVNATAASILAGTLSDAHVTLVAPWSDLPAPEQLPPGDPRLETHLIRETFRHDHRVALRTSVPQTSSPSPFRFVCPAGLLLTPDALRRMAELADGGQYGLVMTAVARGSQLHVARLERTSAVAIALRHCESHDDLTDTVAEMAGVYWIDGSEWAIANNSDRTWSLNASQLRIELDKWKGIARRRQERYEKAMTEVEGWKAQATNSSSSVWLRLGGLARRASARTSPRSETSELGDRAH